MKSTDDVLQGRDMRESFHILLPVEVFFYCLKQVFDLFDPSLYVPYGMQTCLLHGHVGSQAARCVIPSGFGHKAAKTPRGTHPASWLYKRILIWTLFK